MPTYRITLTDEQERLLALAVRRRFSPEDEEERLGRELTVRELVTYGLRQQFAHDMSRIKTQEAKNLVTPPDPVEITD